MTTDLKSLFLVLFNLSIMLERSLVTVILSAREENDKTGNGHLGWVSSGHSIAYGVVQTPKNQTQTE